MEQNTPEFSEITRLPNLAAHSSDIRADQVAELRAALQSDEHEFVRRRLAATANCLYDELNNS